MLQVVNHTPFSAGINVLPNTFGVDTLHVIVKARFCAQSGMTISDKQVALQEVDDYYGEPGQSSIKRPGDYHPGKPATDIIMLGSACAPDRLPSKKLQVMLSVGAIRKDVLVFGNRYWDHGRVSTPDAFETMRLRYENAYGGCDPQSDQVETRNPVGKGYQGKRSTVQMHGEQLPNLEEPNNLITQAGDSPGPACFAAVAPNWEPRVGYAGTYDEHWQRNRAPFLPEDYSEQFMNSASSGLIYPGYLSGGEEVLVEGMHPCGPISFSVPEVQLQADAFVAGNRQPLNFVAETFVLEPNQLEFDITWRAQIDCGKRLSQVEKVEIELGSLA